MARAAPAEHAGAASGLAETGTELGGALGIAALASLGHAIYRLGVTDAAPAAARDSIEQAASVAQRLPTGVVDNAHRAFADTGASTARGSWPCPNRTSIGPPWWSRPSRTACAAPSNGCGHIGLVARGRAAWGGLLRASAARERGRLFEAERVRMAVHQLPARVVAA